ncbi:MAG: InlB B-repeat-containing protein [Oscillospiraceae bacterium]
MKRVGQKKVLSFVLVIVMLTSLCGFYVQAEDTVGNQPELSAETEGQDTGQQSAAVEADNSEEQDSVDSVEQSLEDSEEQDPGDSEEQDSVDSEEQDSVDSEEQDLGDSEVPAVLTAQTISCTASDGAYIAISGSLPEGAYVTAAAVTVELDEGEVLAAYDITIHYADGSEFQPAEGGAVQVSISSPVIEQAVSDGAGDISVYHMETEDAAPEEIAPDCTNEDSVSFTADSFSIYVITSSTGTFGNTGFIEGPSIVKVGAVIDLKSDNANYPTTRNHSWKSSDNLKATVSGSGSNATVTGLSPGDVTITHTFQRKSGYSGWKDASDSKAITVIAPSVTVTQGAVSGATVQLIATPSYFTSTPDIVWSITSGSVNAAVGAATGLVTWSGGAAPNAQVTVMATATSGSESASGSITLTNTKYTVTYNDGVSGTTLPNVPTDSGNYYSGSTVTVVGPGSMTRNNYTFAGWRNASNTYYYTGDTFEITGNTTLTAVWIENSKRFNHIDVELSGVLTVEYRENDTVVGVKHYNLTVSSPQVKVDSGSWDSTPDTTSSTEFRFLNLYSSLTSKIYIKCNVTAVNRDDASDTFTKELSLLYDGATAAGAAAIFRANALCPDHSGLDFVISESEIENTLMYSYGVQYAYYTSTDGGTPTLDGIGVSSSFGPVASAPSPADILSSASGTSAYNSNTYAKGTAETDVTSTGSFAAGDLVFTVKYYRSYTTPVTVTHTVSYTWSGSYPSDAVLPVSANYKAGDPVTIASSPTTSISNWIFNGWTIGGTTAANFSMGDADVTIVGSWSSGYIPPPPPPDSPYTVKYDPGAHGAFNEQSYSKSYGEGTPAFQGAPTGEDGWTFIGWSPVVDPTVTGNKTYVAQWQVNETPPTIIPDSPAPLVPSPVPETPIPENPVPGAVAPVTAPTNTPQTGDSSNILLLALLAVFSAAGLGTVGILTRKKKRGK